MDIQPIPNPRPNPLSWARHLVRVRQRQQGWRPPRKFLYRRHGVRGRRRDQPAAVEGRGVLGAHAEGRVHHRRWIRQPQPLQQEPELRKEPRMVRRRYSTKRFLPWQSCTITGKNIQFDAACWFGSCVKAKFRVPSHAASAARRSASCRRWLWYLFPTSCDLTWLEKLLRRASSPDCYSVNLMLLFYFTKGLHRSRVL